MTMNTLTSRQKKRLIDRVLNSLQNGETKKSAALLEQAIQKYPTDKWLSLFYCEIYSIIGNDRVAIKKLTLLLKREPAFSEGWALLGEIYSKVKKYGEATKAFERALSLKPSESNWLDSLVSLYFRDRKVKNAHKILQNALKDKPHDHWFKLLLALTYLFDDKPEKAYFMAKKVMDEHPGILTGKANLGVYALNLAGTCKMESEEFQDALNYYNEALKINQNTFYSIAQCYLHMKNYKLALRYCRL